MVGEGAAGKLDPELLRILACPACKQPLAESGPGLACRACRTRYPIRDGIPLLIVEKARPIE